MKTNQELLDEISKTIFHYRKDGTIVWQKHTKYEMGLNFIKQAIKIHGKNKFLYGLVDYRNNSTKVSIVCKKEGHIFTVVPSGHLNNKAVCTKCAGVYHYNQQEFLDRCREVHGDKYDYKNSVYKSNREKLEIICPLHGSFWQTPSKPSEFSGVP